ncbi:MAG: chromate transporter [Lachnospiraceae bacterium]|uniref:Chromate transporter n=1 Tax=Candidatus Enterocloster excrementigallinarum TaxID=2838558 RepID=A0A9D2PS88_9FIRM|nr:chromate transporter [Lachnospiraceae bacterium]HJC66258.1 chromate transporter [Candidatus Enterocloster excrementigallinarum]
MILTLLKLFWSFLKIGFTSFGGLSMIPLISHEVVSNGWMNLSEVSDIVAIAEMTPGPLGLNCATFAGIHAAGIPGAIVANLGVLSPTFTVAALAAVFFQKFQKSHRMDQILTGVRPVCIGLLIGVIASFCQTNYVIDSAVSIPAILIGLIDLLLLFKWQVSIPKVILLSAVLGLIFFQVL